MSPRRPPARLVTSATSAALLALLVLLAGPASGDVVRLRTGETVKGRVVPERTNEQVLVMEDYLTGAVREFAWGAVVDEDAERLQQAGGLKFVAQTIECDQIEYRLAGGQTTTITGKVVGEEGGFLILRNRTSAALKIEKRNIVRRETVPCDPQAVYPPEELAKARREKDPPQDARGWFNFAQYCESVGAYPEAKEAFETAASDETFLNRKLAQEGAARVTSIIQDAEALKTLQDLRLALGAQYWKRVRDGIDGFATKHPEAGEAVKKKLELLKTEFAAKRAKAFAELAGKRFEPILKDLIRKKVAPRDVAYGDVQGWLHGGLPTEANERLLKEFQGKDPDATAGEVETAWKDRPKRASSWRKARYGGGSFIVEPPKVLPKTGRKAPTQPQKSSGPAPQIELPKPPTKDSWWKDAPTDERAEFWFAVFVEKSNLFEVDPKKDRVACSKCEGEGVVTFNISNGEQVTVLCPRCGGARFDYAVRYR